MVRSRGPAHGCRRASSACSEHISTPSLNFLSSQSKDVLGTCWTFYGLFQTGGYQRLSGGFGVLQNMADPHWEGIYPIKRELVRGGAIDWPVGGLGPEVAKNPRADADYPAVLNSYDVLDDLDRELREKLVNQQIIERAEIALRTGGRILSAAERATEAAEATERSTAAPSESTARAEVPPTVESARNHKVSCSRVEAAASVAARQCWKYVAKVEGTPWHKAFRLALSPFPRKS